MKSTKAKDRRTAPAQMNQAEVTATSEAVTLYKVLSVSWTSWALLEQMKPRPPPWAVVCSPFLLLPHKEQVMSISRMKLISLMHPTHKPRGRIRPSHERWLYMSSKPHILQSSHTARDTRNANATGARVGGITALKVSTSKCVIYIHEDLLMSHISTFAAVGQ